MIIMWITFIIFAIMTVMLLSGKGGFLIAGYNTSSPQERAKYDEKKLCRVMGIGMLVMTILLLLMALLGENMSDGFVAFFIAATFVDVAWMMYVSNKKCFAEGVNIEDIEKRTTPKWVKWVVGITFFAVGILLVTGDIKISYSEKYIEIEASYWMDKGIAYSDIESLEYRAEGVDGSRVGGFGSFKLEMGNFRNDEFGKYTRYTYTSCEECVVLSENGRILVINGEDEASTRAIYEELLKR